ncbi:MAG TPA: hypothetical protein VI296_04035 [Candidatus Dormibacteraeota bacterium]
MTETTYPTDAGAATYLLTVRGKTAPPVLDDARTMHNATAGAPQSAAGARSLGDLSHNVFAPIGKDHDGQLLFIDFWNSLSGLGTFFSNPQVQAAAAQLFSNRDGIVWSRLDGFGGFSLPVPTGRSTGAVGLLQVAVTSIEQAASAFTAYASATINTARSYGMVSHSNWLRVPNAGEAPTLEVIGVDVWMDADRMNEYYDLSLGFEHFGAAFAGAPDTSVWRSAPGDWVEW